MATIIAGRFETQARADEAQAAFALAGFERSEYGSFYLGPPGQHARHPLGGDAHHDEGTKHSGATAAAGGALGGAAGLAVGGLAAAAGEPNLAPATIVAGAGVGAYVGSLAGALKGSRAGNPERARPGEPVERPAGIMVAVCVERPGMRQRAIEALRQREARDIEEAQGDWRDGRWVDFDPRVPRRPLGADAEADPGPC